MNLEGKKCVVCGAYLFAEDDVVFCPECGAPHHRDCYKSVGKCGLSHLHGTEEQYKNTNNNEEEKEETADNTNSKENLKKCPFCGQEVEDDANFCPYCRSPLSMPKGMNGSAFPQFEVIDASEEIEDGVTAGDVLKNVRVNAGRYIQRFKRMKDGSRVSWNWAAFLLPHGWFAFRKMYLLSALTAVLLIAASLFTVPMLLVEANSALGGTQNYNEIISQSVRLFAEAGPVPIICSLIGLIVNLAVRIVSAMFADYAYKNRVMNSVKEIKESYDVGEAERKKGGVNVFAFLIAVFCQSFLLQIISSFLM